MCDFVNKSGSNVAYQRALDAQAPKKLRGPLSPARSQPPKEPGSPPPPPVKKKQAPRKRALSYTEMMNSGQQQLTEEQSGQPVQPRPQDNKDEEACP